MSTRVSVPFPYGACEHCLINARACVFPSGKRTGPTPSTSRPGIVNGRSRDVWIEPGRSTLAIVLSIFSRKAAGPFAIRAVMIPSCDPVVIVAVVVGVSRKFRCITSEYRTGRFCDRASPGLQSAGAIFRAVSASGNGRFHRVRSVPRRRVKPARPTSVFTLVLQGIVLQPPGAISRIGARSMVTRHGRRIAIFGASVDWLLALRIRRSPCQAHSDRHVT